jgi:hypothetical protein
METRFENTCCLAVQVSKNKVWLFSIKRNTQEWELVDSVANEVLLS